MQIFSVLIIVLSLFFYGCGQTYSGKTPPKALNGVLDLSNWDFSKDGMIKLEGEWEMYQGKLLDPSDFVVGSSFRNNKAQQYKKVPQRKSKTTIPEFSTYRIKININASAEKLFFRHYLNKPGKIWINKQLVLLNGINAEDHLSAVIPKTNYNLVDKVIAIPTVENNHSYYEIIIQVAKVSHLYDFSSPIIGKENQIHKQYNKNIYLHLMFASVIFAMGIYHFALFFLGRDSLYTLFFGLFCISISLASLVQTPPFIIYLLFPDIRLIWPFLIWDQAYSISTILFTLYIRAIFPKETPRIAITICYALAGCFLISSFLNLIYLNATTFQNTLLKLYSLRPFLSFLMVMLCVLSLLIYFYISYKALRNKRSGSKIFFTGFGILFVVTFQRLVIEIFNLPYIFIGIVEGLFCFLFFQAVLIAQNFSRAFSKASSLSKELSSANRHLQNYSTALLASNQKLKQEMLERKKIESQVRQSHKMAAIGNLAGGIAHDFNNVLSSIIGFTELAIEDAKQGSTQEDNLHEVYTAGKRAKDLVWRILTFARQTSEPTKPIQIDTIVKEVLNLIRSSIPTSIDIKQNINSDSLILGNTTQVHQIIMNLCTNAAHAMNELGGILEVSVKDITIDKASAIIKEGLKPGDYIDLKVTDTGTGIPQEVINSIFDPYFTTKDPGEGTGMGLSVVQGIVEKSGGKITVESQVGKGSVFNVFLPITKKRHSVQVYETEDFPKGTERILLIDDEAPIAKMGKRNLERLGYKVTTRTSSLEALELFKSKPNDFELVITDMTMPGITGDKLAVELMKIRNDVPVILCT